jgi:hypothetical protein
VRCTSITVGAVISINDSIPSGVHIRLRGFR